ncbi:hypothetical protein [Nonomuraea endophytica]|uniref:hypothetical protein n=1 Tax=Nonomuraea endophytica TaxID=714136 RepID=UPI0037CC2739
MSAVSAVSMSAIATSLQESAERASADLDATLARVDAKAAMLLAFALVVARPRLHPAALVAVGGAGLLLVAVRPYLPRTGGTGFVAHARATSGAAVQQSLTAAPGPGLDHLRRISRQALAKCGRIRLAVDLVITAVIVLAIAIAAGLLTAP